MPVPDLDMQVRMAAFEFLAEQVRIHGEVLPARLLREGFVFRGKRVALKGVQGIFKPALLPEPGALCFQVAVDDAHYLSQGLEAVAEGSEEPRRAYITVTTRQRLHQQSFRLRVLRAYRDRCALCRLKHPQLLDAAHILPDRDPRGVPAVPNGLALCKLHHAAFDRNFLGIRPDRVVQVRPDILQEADGPMLVHGLQELHGRPIWIPRRREEQPRSDLLEERYRGFLAASPG